ncbi:MAG: XRE family transcriptional regulator, partial [Peptoniphilus sp.]|uniref:LexA family protein n=1 Tax=Peptoniphilus sp. TaxID=1971214 RepID=UPI0025E688C2
VKGESMINANIFDGDIVFIRKQPTLENGEIGAILLDNEATLKRFSKTNNSVILQAENPSMTDWPRVYTSGNIRVLGKLVGVYSKKE